MNKLQEFLGVWRNSRGVNYINVVHDFDQLNGDRIIRLEVSIELHDIDIKEMQEFLTLVNNQFEIDAEIVCKYNHRAAKHETYKS